MGSSTVSIDESIRVIVPKNLAQRIKFLRTLSVHGSIEATIKGNFFQKSRSESGDHVIKSAVDAVVDIISRHSTGGTMSGSNDFRSNRKPRSSNRHNRGNTNMDGRGSFKRSGGAHRSSRGRGRRQR